MITADCQLVNSRLLTEGRLKCWLWYLNYYYQLQKSFLPYSAESFDDHDAAVACFMLGFG